MRVLGIHYFFPPVKVVASRRLWYLYQELAKQTDYIQIITSAQAEKFPQETRFAHAWSLHPVAGKGLREYLAQPGNTSFAAADKRSIRYRWLAALRHSFPFLYFTDEGGPAYRRRAYEKAVSIIEAENITHLISSYRPWADHLVAARLKKQFPHLVWIADFRDLPVDPVRKDVWWPGLQTRFARKIVAGADRLLAVSQGQAAQLSSLHPEVRVSYNGLEEIPAVTAPATDAFIINYTGSIYPRLQSLAVLGDALKTLLLKEEPRYFEVQKKEEGTNSAPIIQLKYAGKDSFLFEQWARQYDLLPLCEISGEISQKEAQARQASASVNVLLSWSAPNYYGVLTAKLFDYLAAGRPVLALVNGPKDPELSAIIEGSGAGICSHRAAGETARVGEWLEALYRSWKKDNGRLRWGISDEVVASLFPKADWSDSI